MAESLVPHRGTPPPNDALSAARVAFPQQLEDFERDARVSFSKLEGKWLLEDDDGSEWEYDEARARWIPSVRPSSSRDLATLGPTEPSPSLRDRVSDLWTLWRV